VTYRVAVADKGIGFGTQAARGDTGDRSRQLRRQAARGARAGARRRARAHRAERDPGDRGPAHPWPQPARDRPRRTGVDNIDVHAATRRGIAVMNAPGANTVSAAEHAMGLLLAQAPPHSLGGGGDASRRMGSQSGSRERSSGAKPSGSSGWGASAARGHARPCVRDARGRARSYLSPEGARRSCS